MFAATTGLALLFAVSASAQSSSIPDGVLATGTMGTTNPPQPTMGTSINQTSDARLLSMNSIDDWCIFAPPDANTNISVSESYEVAWCTKPRNNARVIPDGVISGASLLKTDMYIQLLAYGDFTQLNIPSGDFGGELDPHGATGEGNPVGGNVTTNTTGSDVNYAEWMMFISDTQVCFRICTNANSTYSAAVMCEHKLDEMGCEFVMPGNYQFNGTFETCEADVAYPPGVYPVSADGTSTAFSTFAQYFTGVGTDGVGYTVGDLVTPSAPASTPSSSNCQTTSTISNGVALASLGVTSGPLASSASATVKASSGSGSSSASKSTSSGNAATHMAVPVRVYHEGLTLAVMISIISAAAIFH